MEIILFAGGVILGAGITGLGSLHFKPSSLVA